MLFRDNIGDTKSEDRYNLTTVAEKYVSAGQHDSSALFFHCLAITHSIRYREENIGGLRFDWPHIPLPNSRKTLIASAELGLEIAALLDTETPVNGVTTGSICAELKAIGMPSKVGGGGLQADEFKVTAGWGILGKEDATMPGRGKAEVRALLETDGDSGFHDALRRAQRERNQRDVVEAPWQTVDVYLNDVAYWKNIPLPVWEFTMGGYQVIKKWVSYREHRVLGRALKPEELTEVQNMARRIAALILLQPKLDANYAAVIADVYPFPHAAT